MTARNLTLAFFCPKENEDRLNRLTARVSKYPYCHVELYFETTNQSFSIQLGEYASLRTKTLANDCYEYVTLSVSLKEYDGCLDFCRKTQKLELSFDNLGMWASWFYLGGIYDCMRKEKKKTFCSKVICEALQHGGVSEVSHRIPSNTTPSRLYSDIMSSSRRVCASVPYKRAQIMNQRVIVFGPNKYCRLVDQSGHVLT